MIDTSASLFSFLREQDKKRLAIRSEYKAKMNQAGAKGSDRIRVLFPRMHIEKTHELLRNGLSWHYNGFILMAGDSVIAVDPGVDFLFRLQLSDFDPSVITHIFVSHAHIDHYGGVNSLMDWLIRAKKTVVVLAPASVYESKVVSDYHSARMDFPADWKVMHSSKVLQDGKDVVIGANLLVPFNLYHSAECMGFKLRGSHGTLTYVSDTGYALTLEEGGQSFDLLKGEVPSSDNLHYAEWRRDIDRQITGSDLVVTNIDSFYPNKNSKTHMTVLDAVHMIQQVDRSPGRVVLAHINPVGELEYDEWSKPIAEYVQDATGVACFAPSAAGLDIQA